MKRLLSIGLSLLLILGISSELCTPAFAAISVPKAKSAYVKALKNEKKAKKTYDAANVTYKKGSKGFFQWIVNTKSGWMKEDAKEALTVLNTTSFKKYTKLGNEKDATDLKKMKYAISLFPSLINRRAKDEFHPNLQPPTIRNVYMARAQVQANVSDNTFQHESDKNCYLGKGAECLAWGGSDPFEAWYDGEKDSFIKVRNFTRKKYKVAYGTEAYEKMINRPDFDFDKYLKEISRFGDISHYRIVCFSGPVQYNFDVPMTDPNYVTCKRAKKVFFGLAHSQICFSLEADDCDDYAEGYTYKEYSSLFNEYFNKVYPKKELAAYNKAKKVSRSTLKALKKAATLKKKPTAKRKKKLVTVKWKKLSGVSGYQVSVAEKKGKTKVVATTGKKISSKKIKIKKSKRQYVKVRPFIVVDGKKVYGNWSKAVRTK